MAREPLRGAKIFAWVTQFLTKTLTPGIYSQFAPHKNILNLN